MITKQLLDRKTLFYLYFSIFREKGLRGIGRYAFRDLKSFIKPHLISGYQYGPYEVFTDASKSEKPDIEIIRTIRGGNKPAFIIHGVTVRSGTGYISNLLSLHKDIVKHPREVWEIPFLKHADDLFRFRDHFFLSYHYNNEKIPENDFPALFGSSFITYMYSGIDKQQHILLTYPGSDFLNYFFTFFPLENLVLILRDGRDVVDSAYRTWPHRPFADHCRMWASNAWSALHVFNQHKNNCACWLGRYEDAVRDPEQFVSSFCRHFNLDISRYPFHEIKNIEVIGSSTFREVQEGTWASKPRTSDFNPIQRWAKWTKNQKKIFKKIAGEALIQSGYAQDQCW